MSVILRQSSNGEEVVLLQKALNQLGNFNLSLDGSFGPGTANSLAVWQRARGYTSDGIYNSDVHSEIAELIDFKYIRLSDVDEYANAVGLAPAFLKAVTVVEARGAGFFNNGSCKILYERHIFYNQAVRKFGRKTADTWTNKYPNICHPTWNQSAYLGGVREWDRLSVAKDLDPECALLATSWGMFQIMGFNYEGCGYNTVGDYVADMVESERYHVAAVAMLIKNTPQWRAAAIRLDFNEFARLYNGPAYAQNNYHNKLRKAYNDFLMS